MITVTMHMKGGHPLGFTVQGHARAGAYGRDIVCAAVSSAAYFAANTLTQLAGCGRAQVKEGYMRVLTQEATQHSDLLLKGFLLHMQAMQQQYPKKIQIRYGGVTNASDKLAIIRP